MDLVDTLFQRLFYDFNWPVNGDQVIEELSLLDFEGTGQVQSEVMAMFRRKFSSGGVKEALLKALDKD